MVQEPDPNNASPVNPQPAGSPLEDLTRREEGPWAYQTHHVPQEKTTQTNERAEGGSTPYPAAGSAPTPTPSTPGPTVGSSSQTSAALPQALQSRYRLVRVLGKGGFANVYLAHDSALDQDVAIKVLKLGLTSPSEQDRFLFEARTGAKLRHPNIISVLDIIQSPEGLQMIMEYCPGGTLSDRVKAKGALRPLAAIDMARQVAHALGHAHRRNFVHRDVKPANIFMANDGLVKLGDFGIAAYTDLHEFTQTGMIIGTPLYMAPEQATDSRSVDPRADVYSLGLTLYYALTGKSPRVLDLETIPTPFRALIKQATRNERNERLPSCDQFIAVLDKIQAELKSRGEARAVPVTVDSNQIIEPQTDPPVAAEPPPSVSEDELDDKAAISTETRERELIEAVSATTMTSQSASPNPTAAKPEKTVRLSSLLLFGAGGIVALVAAVLLSPLLRPQTSTAAGSDPSNPVTIAAAPLHDNGATAAAANVIPTPAPTAEPTASPSPSPSPSPTPSPTPEPAPTAVAALPMPTAAPPPPVSPPLVDGIFYPLDHLLAEILKTPENYDKTLVNALKLWGDAARELQANKFGSAAIPLNLARSSLEQALQDAAQVQMQQNQLAFLLVGLIHIRQNNAAQAAPWIQGAYRRNRPGSVAQPIDFRPESIQRVFGLTPAETIVVRRLHPAAPQMQPLGGPQQTPPSQQFRQQPPQRPQQPTGQKGGPRPR